MFHFLAPAGIPISTGDLFRVAISSSGAESGANRFAEQVASLIGVEHAYHFGSGRASLAVILQALSEMDSGKRTEVVIPAYTCFSVASSVVKSGLKVRLCDIEPETLDYRYEDLEASDLSDVLAVAGCSLFGLPCDWNRLQVLKEKQGLHLIDDAAQAFGIAHDLTLAGSRGDIGFFSFGRGKNITTWSGGVAVTNNREIASAMESCVQKLEKSRTHGSLSILSRLFAYGILLRPRLYWIPNSLPFLGLGETVFDPEFEVSLMGELQGKLGLMMFSRVGMLNSIRAGVAQQLIDGLSGVNGITIPGGSNSDIVPYLRLPVLLDSRELRDEAMQRMKKSGIGCSKMYPSPINEIPGISRHISNPDDAFAGARQVADRLITLPTHPYVTDKHIKTMIQTLCDLLNRGSE